MKPGGKSSGASRTVHAVRFPDTFLNSDGQCPRRVYPGQLSSKPPNCRLLLAVVNNTAKLDTEKYSEYWIKDIAICGY